MIKGKKNKTRKMERGGDIHKREAFKHILSIGYELETSSLSKFTLISETTKEGYPILMNTDTARKDLETLQKVSGEEEEDEDEENNLLALRQEEEFEFNAYDRHKKVDKNVSFLVTNDIVESPFIRFLNKSCREVEEEKEEEILYSKEYQEYAETDKDAAKEYMALEKADLKNTLYSFQEKNGKKYQMRFVFHEKEVPCGLFSDVEWIFTYYKPKQSGNIILDTFANAIHNLLEHFENMKEIRGKLFIDTCLSSMKGGNSLMKSKEPIKHNKCEIIANKPQERILFHKPGTNLYYLQSHYYEDAAGTTLGWKDVCITPQMTFSAHISNIIPIMKNMIHDSIRSIPTNTEIFENRLDILNKVEYMVNLLIASYNETVGSSTEGADSSRFVFLQNTPKKKEEYKIMKSYLFLIFYKLFLFYNYYHNSTTIKYFKDSLFFNSRHSNYILYDALKKSIRRYFDNSIETTKVVHIIQKLCVQAEILEKHMVPDIKTLRKNVFRPSNRFDKKNVSYGNPAKSLISYFHFFEDPIDNDTNVDIEDNILYHDYLEYKRIDAYSAKMDLKNDIVLIELRVFTRLLASYVYSILEDNQKEKMKTGICNRMTNNFQPDVRALSLSVLSDFDQYYRKNNLKSKSKTRSNPRSKMISKRGILDIKAKTI
jgi:hypothetical protein